MEQHTKTIAALLSVLLCMSLFVPLQAASTYTAVITPSSISIPYSDQDQTVTFQVSTAEGTAFTMYTYSIPTSITPELLSASAGNDIALQVETQNNNYNVTYIGEKGTLSDLGTLAFKIPGGTAPGTYTISISSGVVYLQGSTDPQTLTGTNVAVIITEAEKQPEGADGTSGGCTAALSGGATATVGDSLEVAITVNGNSFASSQLQLAYDTTCLKFLNATPGTASASGGMVSIAGFGTEKTVPYTYTVAFEAIAAGNALVALRSAGFSTASDAEIGDLTAATITASDITVQIQNREYAVTLPNIFTGYSSVTEGADYTFTPTDAVHYTYSEVTATMGGAACEVIKNIDGSYTIKNVTGALVISATRAANRYDVTFDTSTEVTLPDDDKATYGVDYTFTMPTEENYNISITSITVGDEPVAYSVSEGVVTIRGTDITGQVKITLDKVRTNAAVTVEGDGVSELVVPSVATPGEDLSVTLTPDIRYDYVVTATVNGKVVELTQNGNVYTIAGADVAIGSIVFTVTKTLNTDGFSVKEYLQFDGTMVWLVKNTVDKQTGSVYTYNGGDMLWSDQYDAYCCLMIAAQKDAVLASGLGLRTGTTNSVDYSMDVNNSGKVDANDAQLVYNLYNAKYSSFTANVTMEKVLRADANGDGVVNVNDAQTIISAILGITEEAE